MSEATNSLLNLAQTDAASGSRLRDFVGKNRKVEPIEPAAPPNAAPQTTVKPSAGSVSKSSSAASDSGVKKTASGKKGLDEASEVKESIGGAASTDSAAVSTSVTKAAGAAEATGTLQGLVGAVVPAGLGVGPVAAGVGALALVGGGGGGGGSASAGASSVPQTPVDPSVPSEGELPIDATDPQDLTPDLPTVNSKPVANASTVSVKDGQGIVRGKVAASDIDGDVLTFSLAKPIAGVVFDADGKGGYTVDTAVFKSLGEGKTQSLTASFKVSDGKGGEDVANLVINATGLNDAPTSTIQRQGVSEGGTVTGKLPVSDVDSTDTLAYKLTNQVNAGKFTLNPDGSYSFAATGPLLESLAQGETREILFQYTATDSAGAAVDGMLFFNVQGLNDTPVGPNANDNTAGVRFLNIEAGAPSVLGSLFATDTDTSDIPRLKFNIKQGLAGFSLDATDSADFVFDAAGYFTGDAFAQAAAGEVFSSLTLIYEAVDTTGASTGDLPFVFNLVGQNDAPTVQSADAAGSVKEDVALSATGQIIVNDIDNGAVLTYSGSKAGQYGSFEVSQDGNWTYSLDASKVQSFGEGVSQTETFTVVVMDQFDVEVNQNVVITVVGTNDVAIITGTTMATMMEDATNSDGVTVTTATGMLNVADADTGEAEFRPQTDTNGIYGKFSIGADGRWTYTLDDTRSNVQALTAGATVSDTFTVLSEDGTDSEVVTITITGSNDTASITGTASGAVAEDAPINIASGTLSVADVDTGEAEFRPQQNSNGIYGTFSIGANGQWTYTLDNIRSNVQSLAANATVTDTFTVVSKDGTATQVVTVTITGTNDVPTVTATGVDSSGVSVTASDVDAGAELFFTLDGGTTKLGNKFASGQPAVFSAVPPQGALMLGTLSVTDGMASTSTGLFVALGSTGNDTVTATGKAALYGFDGNDMLSGDVNASADDFILGGKGNDTISGGKGGTDTLDGGEGTDTLSYANHSAAVVVNLNNATDQSNVSGTVVGFENVFGSAFNDTLTGDANANLLFGGLGNDTLSGGDGVDTLDGGAGADLMTGGAGNDIFGRDNLAKFGESFAPSQVSSALLQNDRFVFANGLDEILDFTQGDRLDVMGAAPNLLNNLGATGTLNNGQVYVAYGQWDEQSKTFTASGPAIGGYHALIVQGSGKAANMESGYVLLHDINRTLNGNDFQ